MSADRCLTPSAQNIIAPSLSVTEHQEVNLGSLFRIDVAIGLYVDAAGRHLRWRSGWDAGG